MITLEMLNNYTTGMYEIDSEKTKSIFENSYSEIVKRLYELKDAKLFGQCIEKLANDCILLSMNKVVRYDKKFQRQPISKSYSGKSGSWRVDGLFASDTKICTITSKCKHLFDKVSSISLADAEVIACIDLMNLFSAKEEHKNKTKDVYAILVKPFSTSAINILKSDYPDVNFHMVMVNGDHQPMIDKNIYVESLEAYYNNANLILKSYEYNFRKAVFDKQQQNALQPSYTQLEKATEICETLKEKGKCLEAIACRCGKNVISFVALKQYFDKLEGKIFLYVSSVPQSYDSVVDDAIKVFGDNINITVQTKEKTYYDPTRLNLYVVSFQTLFKYSRKSKGQPIVFVYNTEKNNFDELIPHTDALIIDEAHYGFSDYRKEIEWYCAKAVKLYLTATPFSYNLRDVPTVELTHSKIFENVANNKEVGRLKNIPPLVISLAENIFPDKFISSSMADQLKDNNARPYLVKFVREMINNSHDLTGAIKEYNKRYKNIFADVNPKITINNMLIRVPDMDCGYLLRNDLNKIDESFPVLVDEQGNLQNNYEVEIFNSINNKNPALYINEFFNANNRKHIAIVVDQAILAVTLGKLEVTIDMSDTQSLAQYMQFRSRSLNPNNRNKIGLHIDCKPERTLQMCSDYKYTSVLSLASEARVIEPILRLYNKQFNLMPNDELEKALFEYCHSSKEQFRNNLLSIRKEDFYRPNAVKVFDTNMLNDIFNFTEQKTPDFYVNEEYANNAIVQKMKEAKNVANKDNASEEKTEEEIEKLALCIMQKFKINTSTLLTGYNKLEEIQSFDDVLDKVIPYAMKVLGKSRKEVFRIFFEDFEVFGDDFESLINLIYNVLGYDKLKSDITFKMISMFINIDKQNVLNEQVYREVLMEQDDAVRKFGEVFTPNWLANDMVNLLPQDTIEDYKSTYLEPCCGGGIFLQVLVNKLMKSLDKTIPNEIDRIQHIMSNQLYGVELQEKNYSLSVLTLYETVKQIYDKSGLYGNDTQIADLVKKNLHNGDSLKFDYWGKNDFTTIITNPPYHRVTKEKCNEKNKAQALPFYIEFINLFKTFDSKYIDVIIPSRWMTGGIGTTQFRNEMINDTHIKELHDYANGKQCFPTAEIKGGVCYFLRDINYNGKCNFYSHNGKNVSYELRPLKYKSFCVRYNGIISIIDKVASKAEKTLDNEILSITVFGFKTTFKDYTTTCNNDSIKIYGNGYVGYIDKNQLKTGYKYVDKYKVILPEAIGSGGFKDTLKPILVEPNSCCTATYVVIGNFDTEAEAKNLISYINTKFFRFLLAILKITHHATARVYQLIPVQDFSKSWSDEELYKKYDLSEEEIEYIEENIK